MVAQLSVFDVCQYIIKRCPTPKMATMVRLQRLCFLGQLYSVHDRDVTLFIEKVYPWFEGPTIEALIPYERDRRDRFVVPPRFDSGDAGNLNADERTLMDEVINDYLLVDPDVLGYCIRDMSFYRRCEADGCRWMTKDDFGSAKVSDFKMLLLLTAR